MPADGPDCSVDRLALTFYGKLLKFIYNFKQNYIAPLPLLVLSLDEVREEAGRWVFLVRFFFYHTKTPYSRPSFTEMEGSLSFRLR